MTDKKIKLIHIIPTLSMGGAERLLVDISKNLSKDIFDIEVICIVSSGIWKMELETAGIKVSVMGKKKGFSLKVFFTLLKMLKEKKPDIVHTHLFGADFYGRIVAYLAKVKTIVSTEHNLNFSEGFVRRILKRITNNLADVIIAVSEAVKDYAIKKEGADPRKVQVILNGVKINKFLNTKRDYNKNELIIGSVGRLEKQKGYDLLLEAIFKAKDQAIKCEIVGEGKERDYLEKRIHELRLFDQVKFIGQREDTPDFLNNIDIFVLPSRWEGLGIVILEAGLSGLPVIASNIDGIKEIIDDNQNGLLFEKANTDDLSDKLKTLLTDGEKRKELGESLQDKIKNNFDIKKIAEKYQKLYLEYYKK